MPITAAVAAGGMGEVCLLPILLVTNWTAELEKQGSPTRPSPLGRRLDAGEVTELLKQSGVEGTKRMVCGAAPR